MKNAKQSIQHRTFPNPNRLHPLVKMPVSSIMNIQNLNNLKVQESLDIIKVKNIELTLFIFLKKSMTNK